MKRRAFLKFAGLAALFHRFFVRDLFAAQGPVVAVATNRDHAAATRSAIAALGGMKRFVKKGDVVVVKPNIGWDRSPEQAANTNPTVVKTVVQEALAAGAKKVKVFDRPCNDERRCYVNSGIKAALAGMKNVELKFMEVERYRKVTLNGKALPEWDLYDEALDANVFINVPVAKNHGLTRVTAGLKNVMGVMGRNRGSIHRKIDESLADVNRVLKSHLVVVDATRILTDNGPQGGNLADVKILNKVLASTDIVAIDAYATTLFGLKPEDIAVTVAAHRRGLGEIDLKKVRLMQV
ncbi:DUF362 domain-containing protein [Geomonas sp. RF6]|uniref:DUF362 domain-containing protein n=1 Tax=Geomonas sp. RF6 TaxID=2897342 RepID=UPI001E28FD4F|nr:DUF362 domain-containing protein [Geomonas sp. RF6]UFS69843.1 DUF362 domain-containing protein [Geomonas sp. RF6]